MERKQFTFYGSFFEGIQKLRTKKEKAEAYDIICNYALYGIEPNLNGRSPLVATVFSFAKPVLDTAAKRAARLKMKAAENKLLEVLDKDGAK